MYGEGTFKKRAGTGIVVKMIIIIIVYSYGEKKRVKYVI